MKRDTIYRAGMSAYQEGRYGDAIGFLEMLAGKIDTAEGILSRFYLARAHYEVALTLFHQKRLLDATRHFHAASQLSPAGLGIARYLASCYTAQKEYRMASAELERLLRHHPSDSDARIRLALICWRDGQREQSLSILTEGLRLKPDDPELHYQLGVLHASEERWDRAESCFIRAHQLDATHARACERMAQCCSVQGRNDAALHYLKKANEADPEDARIAWQLSLLAPRRHMHGDPVRFKRRGAGEKTRMDEVAIRRLSEAILSEPDFVEAFLSLPESQIDGEVFSLLAGTLEHALAVQPRYADLHYHCGAVLRRLGRTMDAVAHVERAVSINPRYINALILLARLYGETDRAAEGVERLQKAIEAGGDYPDVHFLLGRLAQREGHLDLARASYEAALSLNPAYPPAAVALAHVNT